DVSDGLVQDAGHVCRASGVGAELLAACLPVAAACRRAFGGPAAALFAATAGEDYELLVALPPRAERALPRLRRRLGCRLTRVALPDHGDRQVAGLRAREVLQGDLRDALDRRDGAADVPVDPEAVCLVHLPPRPGRGIEGSTRDDRVDQPPGLRVLDEDADALAQRIDRRRVRIGELHAATELERAARGAAALAELQRRPDERSEEHTSELQS